MVDVLVVVVVVVGITLICTPELVAMTGGRNVELNPDDGKLIKLLKFIRQGLAVS